MTEPNTPHAEAAGTTTITDPPPSHPPPPPPPPGTPGNRGGGSDRPLPPPRPARRSPVWLVVGSLLAVLAVLWGAFQVVLLLAHEEETVTSTIPAADVSVIDARNSAGSVELVVADVEEITIRAEVSHGLRRTGHSHELDGDRMIIRGSCPNFGSSWCDLHYRIEIPTDHADVDVVTRGDGTVTIRGVDGTVDARSHNGSITADDLGGRADLRSHNGSVEVTRHRGDRLDIGSHNGGVFASLVVPPSEVSAVSHNGGAEVLVPEDGATRYAVEVESANGSRNNGVVTDPGSDRRIHVRTHNGDATVRYR